MEAPPFAVILSEQKAFGVLKVEESREGYRGSLELPPSVHYTP